MAKRNQVTKPSHLFPPFKDQDPCNFLSKGLEQTVSNFPHIFLLFMVGELLWYQLLCPDPEYKFLLINFSIMSSSLIIPLSGSFNIILHSPIAGPLGYLELLPIINNDAMNISVKISI